MDNSIWIKYNDNSTYTWDANIGKYGGFNYKNENNEITTQEIQLENIGQITPCKNTIIYSHINNCIGLNNTTIDLIPEIPKDSKFGWDTENLCWIYYKNSDVYPSYYANKIETA
jgi:hypothetical protein